MVELARQAPAGLFVEVGVYQGGSAWHLAQVARERDAALHLFDTFTGTPFADPEDRDQVGSFSDTMLEAVRKAIPDAVFHPGLFPETLPADLVEIAFVHCDCDQYRSVRAVIEHLWPRLVPGGLMVFDDDNTPGGKHAITEGIDELLELKGRVYARKPDRPEI